MIAPITTQFETEQDFVLFINSFRFISPEMRDEMIQHEREHYNSALALGFYPKYAVSVSYEGNKLKSIKAHIALNISDSPSLEEIERLKKVLTSPRLMSQSDGRRLEAIIKPFIFENVR